jgi:hypothetical protein
MQTALLISVSRFELTLQILKEAKKYSKNNYIHEIMRNIFSNKNISRARVDSFGLELKNSNFKYSFTSFQLHFE